MKKFELAGWWSSEIKAVTVEKETDQSVWIGGRRRAKRSDYLNYFDSWEQARSALIERAEREADSARKSLHIASNKLAELNAMTPPEDEQA